MIKGQKIDRPSKEQLADEIAILCGLSIPSVSRGSSIDSAFLDGIHSKVAGIPSGASDTYRKTEQLLESLGRSYDPYWDTSESAPAGGGTVTVRAFSRIRTALTGIPRCFIVNVTDAPEGIRWERNHQEVYRYDGTVSGRRSLNDAGPESRIVYYATRKSSSNPMHFTATATVAYIEPGWHGPWSARLEDYCEFPQPVPVDELELEGWNRQNAITEISFDTYVQIIAEGGLGRGEGLPAPMPHASPAAESVAIDTSGRHIAERVLEDFPVIHANPLVDVPADLPSGVLRGDPPVEPSYVESNESVQPTNRNMETGWSRDRISARLAEVRAVQLATKAMESDGWSRTADRQMDGVGYDLEFTKADRLIKLEVKGIQGSQVTFNLTPKEFWRAQTDPAWALVAVTSVLSPRDFLLYFVTRDQIVSAFRTITGYRVTI